MNSSCGFTKHGIEKIGDSIKVYMYLILSSRQAARHGIIWDGAQAAAAQEIFVDNLENVINREVSLEDDIACLLYTSPSPRDQRGSRMPSSA